MHVIPAGPTAFFDVDSTLIEWDVPKTATESDKVIINCRNKVETHYVNKHNLEFLRRLAVRGHAIVVWSAGGVDWAEAVVKALKIETLVWAVMSKPTYYVDDVKNASDWIGKHRFYDFDGNKGYEYDTIVKQEKKE